MQLTNFRRLLYGAATCLAVDRLTTPLLPVVAAILGEGYVRLWSGLVVNRPGSEDQVRSGCPLGLPASSGLRVLRSPRRLTNSHLPRLPYLCRHGTQMARRFSRGRGWSLTATALHSSCRSWICFPRQALRSSFRGHTAPARQPTMSPLSTGPRPACTSTTWLPTYRARIRRAYGPTASLPACMSAARYARAGTAIYFDYEVIHRGTANTGR